MTKSQISSPYMRPVSKKVGHAIGDLPSGPFNFGLYFNKWLYIEKHGCKCHADVPRKKKGEGIELGDNLEISLRLFNGQKVRIQDAEGVWSVRGDDETLSAKHDQQEKLVQSFERLGFGSLYIEASLISPLVIGLGNEHPTEKGFRFDWTTGLPAIPATSIKGVVRLAYLVNALNERDDENEAELFWNNALKGKLDPDAYTLFGCGEETDQSARRGNVIFLDAFPKELPRLKAEIMNCHYPDYLNKDSGHPDFRGPTEDQQPYPHKFWAVDSWVDEKRTRPLHFIFRVLASRDIVAKEDWFEGLKRAVDSALQEHGLGAKTAIGHGRFRSAPDRSDSGTAPEIDRSKGVGKGGQVPKPDPETVRREAIESFSKSLSDLPNAEMPGKIEMFFQKVRAQEDAELKESMCRLLVEKGQSLEKKKKLTKALSDKKKWALELKALCEESGVEI